MVRTHIVIARSEILVNGKNTYCSCHDYHVTYLLREKVPRVRLYIKVEDANILVVLNELFYYKASMYHLF